MSHQVLDSDGRLPTNVMSAGTPFQIRVTWNVPAAAATMIGSSDTFRLRAFAESIGPGQELMLGGTALVPGVANQTAYEHVINVSPNPLLGEGATFGGQAVSGLYKIAVVAQHLNDGIPTVHSGVSDNEPSVFFRLP
jgi:hypothetical protein